LPIKFDYYIKYYSRRSNTYRLDRTIVTVGAPRMLAMSTSPASVGASSCARRLLPPVQQQQQRVQRSPALLWPPLLPQQQLRALCSLEEQGAGAPSAPGALRQCGLGYDSQRVPPPCPTRLCHPDQRAP
jgi:hypothetical protein